MKITDVTVTLFEWKDMVKVNYVRSNQTGKHDQGLLTISTDQGIQGHAFLGKTIDPALRQHGLAGQASRAHTAAQGRRINPVRRTG